MTVVPTRAHCTEFTIRLVEFISPYHSPTYFNAIYLWKMSGAYRFSHIVIAIINVVTNLNAWHRLAVARNHTFSNVWSNAISMNPSVGLAPPWAGHSFPDTMVTLEPTSVLLSRTVHVPWTLVTSPEGTGRTPRWGTPRPPVPLAVALNTRALG